VNKIEKNKIWNMKMKWKMVIIIVELNNIIKKINKLLRTVMIKGFNIIRRNVKRNK
jgi:hypothetical protein